MRRRLFRVVVPAAGVILLAAGVPQKTPESGLDVQGFDRSISPRDDLSSYVNAGWLSKTSIPPDEVTHGAFVEIANQTERDLQQIIDDIRARPDRPRGSPEQQIADLYASAVEEPNLAARDGSTVLPELARIDAIDSARDFAEEAGRLASLGRGGPFGGSTGVDPLNPGAPIVRITQGGTLLPDGRYYLDADVPFAAARAGYLDYLARIFELTGRPEPATDARAVLEVETSLARIQSSHVEPQGSPAAFRRFTLTQLSAEMPGFDWTAWARPQGIDRSPYVILAQPSFFSAFAALVPTVPLEAWRAWLAARYVTASAPYLSASFQNARFKFFGRELTGQEAPRPRWKQAVMFVSESLGDAIGRLYTRRHFTRATGRRIDGIVRRIVEAYEAAVRDDSVFSGSARREALAKLRALRIEIGVPPQWRSYRGLLIEPDDLAGNMQRVTAFDAAYHAGRVPGGNGGTWTVPPQSINAYYSAADNEIVIPAGILQPPIFTPEADDAVNYGAIGAIVAHEIGHALDEHGRWMDSDGSARDWWTAADAERFHSRWATLAAQLSTSESAAGTGVDGERVAEETLGDIVGLTVAYRAYASTLHGRSPVIDGMTGEQRLFMGWAQIWRAKEREAYLRSTARTSAYLPFHLRANTVVSNVDAFYDAFGVTPRDRLYRAPRDRVRSW